MKKFDRENVTALVLCIVYKFAGVWIHEKISGEPE